jgi:competence protein ComEA
LFLVFGLAVQIPAADQVSKATKLVNINTASAAELTKLPRVGEKMAQRIIDFRKKHGKFKRVQDLMKVKGIGEKVFQQLKNRITV